MDAVRFDLDADGVAWIVFDKPDSKVNIFDADTMGQFDAILDKLTQQKPRGVVVTSGKPDTFIAGADIKELAKIRDAAHGTELSRAGHRVFNKLEQLGVLAVAAIDGAGL